jgi:hypothetical protein
VEHHALSQTVDQSLHVLDHELPPLDEGLELIRIQIRRSYWEVQ